MKNNRLRQMVGNFVEITDQLTKFLEYHKEKETKSNRQKSWVD